MKYKVIKVIRVEIKQDSSKEGKDLCSLGCGMYVCVYVYGRRGNQRKFSGGGGI